MNRKAGLVLKLVLLALASCGDADGATAVPPTTPVAAVREGATAAVHTVPEPTHTSEPAKLWIDPDFPAEFELPVGMIAIDEAGAADLRLYLGGENPAVIWTYALVAPFADVRDDVSAAELLSRWRGDGVTQFTGTRLLVSERTFTLLSRVWGEPPEGAVEVMPAGELLEEAWNRQPAWAVVPFEQLEPRWKVLSIDGQSPIQKRFDGRLYALSVPFSLGGEAQGLARAGLRTGQKRNPDWLPSGNRDEGKLTTVVVTGVTALVRATAWTMEVQGVTYPGSSIGEWLRQADITHISNEVPFAENCPFPNPQQQGVVFCSDARYIDLLKDVGTDVVELTGDHFHDWGAEAMLYTLELYKEAGWPTYGGGETYEQGRLPAKLTHNGNRIAFIGCNGKGGGFARASASSPGSVACDIPWMQEQIVKLHEKGYLVIGTFQHQEHYSYAAPAGMKGDFRALAEAGAVIVSGSQAHQPHGFEFWQGGLIHYGLGNLFFDQFDISEGTRQAFIDRHVFYDGRYISTELLAVRFVDFARPRPMEPWEREAFLRTMFAASGW